MTPSSPPPEDEDGPSEEQLFYYENDPTNTGSRHSLVTEIPDLGCIHRILCISLNIIHFLQFSTGVAALSYAIAISCHRPDPQHGIASLLELYALLLLAASVMGTVGIHRPNCKRVSLVISLRLAPFLVALICLVALILLFEKSSFLRYIAEKQHTLYLSDRSLLFLQHHLNVMSIILLACAVVEVIRYYMLKRLKENLRQYDAEQRTEMLRSHARSLATSQQQQQRQRQRQQKRQFWGMSRRSPRLFSPNQMEVPLLSDQLPSPTDLEQGRGEEARSMDSSTLSFQKNESLSNSGVSWWEEPSNENNGGKTSSRDDGGGGWMSKVMKKNNPSSSLSKSRVEKDALIDGDSISSVQFAPIDEQMDFGTTPWNETSNSDEDEDKPPDLSWANEHDGDV